MNKLMNFIKKFILNIKNKLTNYNTESKEQQTTTKSIINNTETKNNIILTSINRNLINKLKNYDIVLVKMDEKSIIESNLDDKKQKRPFLIIDKNDYKNTCYGYYFTTNINNHFFFKKEENKGLKIVLNHNKYNFNNNSLITINNLLELPYDNIIHYIDHLDEFDHKRLEKHINLLNDKTVVSNKDNKVIEIGDIILDNDIYYIIYQTDNTNCYAYPITLYNKYIDLSKNYDYFLFNHKVYFVDYKNYKTFNLNDNIFITNRFNYDVVDTIKENKKIKKAKQKNRRKP